MSTATSISGLSPERQPGESATTGSREAKTFPLSYGQEQLWFIEQLAPGRPIYNIDNAKRLKFSVDARVLEQCFNEVVHRHEILRTTFRAREDSHPMQVVAPAMTMALPVVDLRGFPEDERELEALRLATEEVRQPFNLTEGPLLRANLLRLGEEDYILLLTMHHIITDGWSMGVLFRELEALYTAFSQGKPSPLPDFPAQYGVFSARQRQRSIGPEWSRHLDYWKTQLANLPDLNLPTNRVRPSRSSYNGACHSFSLPAALAASLRALGRQEGVSLFVTLLAAFQTLLYRYTGLDDIVVGTPVANRNDEETRSLIGFCVNTVVLRTDFSGNPSFLELVRRVGAAVHDALEHQELPFERLVQELQPQRNLSRNPLFQVVFQRLRGPRSTQPDPDLFPSWRPLHTGTSKFDLDLDLVETAEGISGYLEYCSDLFDGSTISGLAGHFLTLLRSVAGHPERRVSTLAILTAEETQRILVEWNVTASDYPRDQCIHELFEVQAHRTPQTVAATFEGRQLTYDELNRRANQLARLLLSRGIGPGAPVAVCMKPSLQMLVALLGILKTGGFYVPIDPSYPRERVSFMLKDVGAEFLVCRDREAVQLEGFPLQKIEMDHAWSVVAEQAGENLGDTVTAGHLAYVMYTSGSTGKPKGVAVPHRAVNRLISGANYVQWNSDDRVAQVSNVCFDAATFEIWGALLTGAQLVGISSDVVLSPRAFATELRRQQISVLFLTTDLVNQLVRETPDIFRTVGQVFFGGSAVDPRSVCQIVKHGPPQRLVHVYGPTENTTFSSWHLVREVAEDAKTIPIGRPISNTQIYLLDQQSRPVPTGVSGEIYLGGDGLAHAYHACPELTAERFVPDAFGNTPGCRLYRTGDLGRYLSDGSIEFLGRLDDQVKIRGFRVEPAEIEAALRRDSRICDCRVVARRDGSGQQRLAAYVVPREQPGPSFDELRSLLKKELPGYMVPSAYVLLAALPIGTGGKVISESLPEPSRPSLEVRFQAPRSGVEQQLASIWSEVLGLERIGVDDDFFELGGHSLLATQVLSRVRESLGWEVPLRALFERPTVAELAEWVESQQQAEKQPCRIKAAESQPQSGWPGVVVDQLSDEEVDSMLKGYLAKGMPE